MAEIAHAFQHDRAVERLTGLLQVQREGSTTQQALFFETKSGKPYGTRDDGVSELIGYLEQDGQSTGIIIGARRGHDCIVMCADEQRSLALLGRPSIRSFDGENIDVRFSQSPKRLPGCRPLKSGKLCRQICCGTGQRFRSTVRMAFSDQRFQVAEDTGLS